MMMSIRVKSRAWTDVSTSAVLVMSRSQATAGQATAGQASIADHHRGFSCTCLLGGGGTAVEEMKMESLQQENCSIMP